MRGKNYANWLVALGVAQALFSMPVGAFENSVAPAKTPAGLKIQISENNISEDSKLAAGAKNFVSSMGQRGIGFLSDPNLSDEARRKEFRKLLRTSFDMKSLARFSLGRYWKTATPQQKEEYTRLFEDMVVDVYSKRFDDYKGQNFEVRDARPDGKRDAIVTSSIVPESGPEIEVQWRVRHKDGVYKVIDVIIEGVSMALTQRSDFASVIQRGGGDVQVLLAHLRNE